MRFRLTVLTLLSCTYLQASSFSIYSVIGATQSNSPVINVLTACTDTQTTAGVNAHVAAGCVAYNSGGTVLTISGDAYADAQKLGSANTFSLANGIGPFSSSSYARVTDRLQITNLDPNGFLRFSFLVDGTATSTNMLVANARLTFGFNYFNQSTQPALPFGMSLPSSGSFQGVILTPLYPVSYFLNNDYFVSFTSQDLFNRGVSTNASAQISYLNTAAIAGVTAYDSSGNLARSALITSDGMQATGGGNFAIVDSPEPSGLGIASLGMFGFAALGFFRRRLEKAAALGGLRP